jgi:hypothetical protein
MPSRPSGVALGASGAGPAATVDDELAVAKVNPVLDHGLGAVMLALIGRFLLWAYAERSSQPELLRWFGQGALFAIGGTYAVGWVALKLGGVFSEARCGSHLPEDCRRPLSSAIARKKFKDQTWQLAIHLSMALWEVRLLLAHPGWWSDAGNPETGAFAPCPATVLDDPSSFGGAEVRMFYIMQLALWMWTGVSCKWLEERRKDYVEMMAHHVLTVALILNSFMRGEVAIGVVVLTVHDTSDVVLDLMKIANYLKVEDAHGCYVVEVLFVLNTYVTWPYMRMWFFPRYVIGACFKYYAMCDSRRAPLASWLTTAPWRPFVDNDIPGWATSTGMLMVLFGLHIMWWLLMNRIGMKIMFEGKAPNQAGDEEYEISKAREAAEKARVAAAAEGGKKDD